jgi:hypothetical protein
MSLDVTHPPRQRAMEALNHEMDSISPEPDSKRRKLRKGTKSVCNIPVQTVQVPALEMSKALRMISGLQYKDEKFV